MHKLYFVAEIELCRLLSRCLSSLFVFSEDQSNTILAPETLPNLFLGLSARHEICSLIGWNPQESCENME
ncbi:unnamed protein product [Cylicocyclus nassatus]|uniref:Uncharacterized protein n=1 Tax=Cylicocyclus nassatus TaxID=53992 RepID=A0AA36M4R5_CYLNA|nr:unnamed protein product [Cylicocyclus nassatus]